MLTDKHYFFFHKKYAYKQSDLGLNCMLGHSVYIYMERYNKSTVPENAEKYFMTHRRNRTHDLDNIYIYTHIITKL